MSLPFRFHNKILPTVFVLLLLALEISQTISVHGCFRKLLKPLFVLYWNFRYLVFTTTGFRNFRNYSLSWSIANYFFFFFLIFHKCLWTDFNKILIFLNGKIALRQKLMLVSAISADLSGIEFASFIKMIESEKAHFTAIENRLIFIF